jgi:hypothetical protein
LHPAPTISGYPHSLAHDRSTETFWRSSNVL